MAGAPAPLLVSICMCILGLMCCESLADSRPVHHETRRRSERKTIQVDLDGVDDGPATFTMQDHFNFLKNRELEMRARADQKRTHQAVILGTASTSTQKVTSTPTIFVDDYGCTSSNTHNDPSVSCPPGG